MTTVLD